MTGFAKAIAFDRGQVCPVALTQTQESNLTFLYVLALAAGASGVILHAVANATHWVF